jgi:23S rRNA G2445 N2-methylase RlmL
MKNAPTGKELYQQLRALPWAQLWQVEVPRFDLAAARERFERVGVIRAVGVVFSESGPREQKEAVTLWLRGLLQDPEEKVRRYAMAALPKIGSGAGDEAALLALRETTANAREERYVGRALNKIGSAATLEALSSGGFEPETEQRVKASVAREQAPSTIRLDAEISGIGRLRIHLRGRRGLENYVREEVQAQGKFRVVDVDPGLVAITALSPFTLADVFALRCFGTVGFVLGLAKRERHGEPIEALASLIASPLAQRLFAALTEGSLRYRLEFIGKGHQRSGVRRIADRAFALNPTILNDAREAPWAIDIHSTPHGESVELRPRISPDPRYAYRCDDVPAASHPPLAACLARAAGHLEKASIWDPFCGSGLELIERALLGGVKHAYGTDRDAAAIGIIERNFASAKLGSIETHFHRCDFREIATAAGLAPHSLDLIITNPPLGRRVRIPNLRGLFDDLFAAAARMLRPGGRLVFTNPFRMESPQRSLKLQSRQVVDLGGFDCRLEVYRKAV